MTAAAAPPNALAKRALPIAVAALAVYPALLILKGAAERPTAFLRNLVEGVSLGGLVRGGNESLHRSASSARLVC